MTSSGRPVFRIVGGPNGSGKTSLYGNTEIEAFDRSVRIINPDLLTQRIQNVAKQRRFASRLIFVMLASPDLNVLRVRVGKGGHDVPEAKIMERRSKLLRQLPWFLDHADGAAICDNSGAVPRLVGHKQDGVIAIDLDASRALREVLGLIGGAEG